MERTLEERKGVPKFNPGETTRVVLRKNKELDVVIVENAIKSKQSVTIGNRSGK